MILFDFFMIVTVLICTLIFALPQAVLRIVIQTRTLIFTIQAIIIIVICSIFSVYVVYYHRFPLLVMNLPLFGMFYLKYRLMRFFITRENDEEGTILDKEYTSQKALNLPGISDLSFDVLVNTRFGKIIYYTGLLATFSVTAVLFSISFDFLPQMLEIIASLLSVFLVGLIVSTAIIEGVIKIELENFDSLTVEILKKRLNDLQPQFLLYYSAPDKASLGQIYSWIPYLRLIGAPFYLIIRETKHIDELKENITDVPVVFASKLSEVEELLVDTVKTVFYINNGTKNTHMVRFNDRWHIQLLHGDSEKPPSYSPVSKMYDRLFVAGQRAIDRYNENNVNIGRKNFEIVGRPQTDNIQSITGPNRKEGEPINVLVAPTWLGFNEDAHYSSLYKMPQMIDYLFTSKIADFKIILRLHPMSLNSNSEDRKVLDTLQNLLKKSSNNHVFNSEKSIVEDFNDSDFLITDISSVPIDYLASGKPIIHVDMGILKDLAIEDRRFIKYMKGIYLIDTSFSNAQEILKDVIYEDSRREKRKEITKYFLGDLEKSSTETFVETSRKYLSNKLQS